jgi:hypothetical protein
MTPGRRRDCARAAQRRCPPDLAGNSPRFVVGSSFYSGLKYANNLRLVGLP